MLPTKNDSSIRYNQNVKTPATRQRPGAWQPLLEEVISRMNATKFCSIDECENPAHGRGMCRTHYMRWWRHGDARYEKPLKRCSAQGCERTEESHEITSGLCNMHYLRWRRHGDPNYQREPEICSIDGCGRKINGRGLCNMHYKRWKKHGDPNYVKPVAQGCKVDGCTRPHNARGWCELHYRRWLEHGDPETLLRFDDPEESFKARTVQNGACLEWMGGRTSAGYGLMHVHGENQSAHRYAWKRANGDIPEGKVIDHICHNRACVNLDHLRLATISQNSANREGPHGTNIYSGRRNVHKRGDTWEVRLYKNSEVYRFGEFKDVKEAVEVAEAARASLFGEFAGRG